MPFVFQDAYDELNAADEDHRFYLELALRRRARTVVDLGCGTGTLARLLAQQGIDVVAVDPDPEMLRVARSKPTDEGGTGRVEWRPGDSSALGPSSADLAVMSGHVAQVFLDERSWHQVLVDLRAALHPVGTLAFESRNPGRRLWEEWTRARTSRTLATPDGEVELWHQTVRVELPLVAYDTFALNRRTGEQTVHRDVLAFRDEPALRRSLEQAGFLVEDVLGSWDGGPASVAAPELIVVARAR